MKNKFRSIFHWILVDELAVGSLPKDEKDIDFLKREGVNSILSLCSKEEGYLSKKAYKYFICKSFALPDHTSKRLPTINELNSALDILQKLIKKGSVYVHCFAGVERSPLLCMAYIMVINKIDRQTALEYMMQTHPQTNPLKGQLDLLDELVF